MAEPEITASTPTVTYTPQPQPEPPRQDNVSRTIDGIRIVLDNGGMKATIVKFILWFALPLVILLVIAYFLYTSFFLRKANIETRGGLNRSSVYKDEKTDWSINVTNVNNQANVDADIARFEEISKKVKGLYVKWKKSY